MSFKRVYVGRSRTWGGSVANIVRHADSEVIGYAVNLTSEEVAKLDVFEGFPDWYNRIPVDLHSLHGDEEVKQGIVYEMVKPEMLV